MVVAAGVAIGGGGLGGITALGQLLEGPADPAAAIGVLDAADDTLAADPEALITGLPSSGAGAAPGTGGGGGADGGGDTGRGGGGGGDRGGGDGGGDGPDGGAPPVSAPPAAAAPEPEPEGPVEELGRTTEPVEEALPQPVGPLTGELIDQVVEIGEQLLGQPGGSGALGGLGRLTAP